MHLLGDKCREGGNDELLLEEHKLSVDHDVACDPQSDPDRERTSIVVIAQNVSHAE